MKFIFRSPFTPEHIQSELNETIQLNEQQTEKKKYFLNFFPFPFPSLPSPCDFGKRISNLFYLGEYFFFTTKIGKIFTHSVQFIPGVIIKPFLATPTLFFLHGHIIINDQKLSTHT